MKMKFGCLLVSITELIVCIILVLVWKSFSSEWWSPALLVLAVFVFYMAIQAFYYAGKIDYEEHREKEKATKE